MCTLNKSRRQLWKGIGIVLTAVMVREFLIRCQKCVWKSKSSALTYYHTLLFQQKLLCLAQQCLPHGQLQNSLFYLKCLTPASMDHYVPPTAYYSKPGLRPDLHYSNRPSHKEKLSSSYRTGSSWYYSHFIYEKRRYREGKNLQSALTVLHY